MTIAYRSVSSTVSAGANTYLFRQPDVVEANDYAMLAVVSKYPAAVPDVPTGYTLLASGTGGSGADGADVGQILITVDTRICDGTEDAATQSLSVSGGNCVTSRSICYGAGAESSWEIATAFGAQTAHVSAWSITTNESLDLRAGDVLIGVVGKSGDVDTIHSTSHVVSANGVTFGTVTPRIGTTAANGTTQGDDCALHVFEVPVTSGSGTGPVSMTIDWSGTGTGTGGGALFVRLRESSGSSAAAQYFNLL